MLKIAGWIISDTAVDAWRIAHPEVKHRQTMWATSFKVFEVLQQRHVKFPFREDKVVEVCWPKVGNLSMIDCLFVVNNLF